ncbi:uncharacterized protein JN550_013149 [Neoarthrinium moseri]|uniref:uncharacterized protein n=1 Tax=Neoarthrinium moseri TaxID=1658444 RepID=UPI001FDCEBF8|nr:uncharacterized protein JN550_013149 [Neoarthrinium moseri]KAI1857580.1 hypothetical protein JN550_013149 [Neoarthrinium moseri]
MKLLRLDDPDGYSLTPDLTPNNVLVYAILSHTWGPDEVVFTDLSNSSSDWQQKSGYDKIEFCAKQAKKDGFQYVWVDTCCIDKSDAIELQTAINSMFRWYRDAERCYVYLSDVSVPITPDRQQNIRPWEAALRQSRWFTRGWTLQELVAPKIVEFYSKEGVWLGDKRSLEPLIRDITGIPARALRGTPLVDFTVAEREAWARNRRERAQNRLREEVEKAVKGTHTNDFSVPFSLSEVPETQYFVAREREIDEMRRRLSSDGSRRVVVLHGLGGIGKTQLAVEYTKRYRDEHTAIFWVNIKDETSIQQSFTRVARQILQRHPHTSGLRALDLQGDKEEVIEAVKAWLSLPDNTRWLVVYDNYDNPRLPNHPNNSGIDINHFIPTSYQGSIIITTRLSQVDIGHRIRLKKLESIDDGLEILSATSARDGLPNDMDARGLVQELDGLPLALTAAGAYLRRVSISVADYLRLYRESWARLQSSTPSLGSYQDRTLSSTWQISYDQMQEHDPLAAHLLRWWAYFDNEDLWFELLQPLSGDGPAWVYELSDELNFNKAMGILHDYGFVEPHDFSPDLIESRGYSIHGCLHSWIIYTLNRPWDGYLNKLAIECIASKVPSQTCAHTWIIERRLLSHAVMSCTTILGYEEDLYWAFHNLGILYMAQCKPQEAENAYLRALRGMEKALGRDHNLTLRTVYNLGVFYITQYKLQKAEDMLLRALRGNEKVWGPDYPLTLNAVDNLGVLLLEQGKMKEAENMVLRALQGYEKMLGPDYPSTLDAVYSLGVLSLKQGKIKEAESIFLLALRVYEKVLGPDHPSTLDAANSLGVLYSKQGKIKEAENMHLRALQGNEKVLEPDHPSTLDAVYSLGVLYSEQGKMKEAEDMYSSALRGAKKVWGSDHPLTLKVVHSLDVLSSEQGKMQDAKAI